MSQSNTVRLRELFISFLKIGLFTFGGGYAMLSLIKDEVITRRGWVASEQFLELLTLAQSAPGPIALNTSVFVGYSTRGYKGAIAAITGVVTPSIVIILLLAIFFTSIRDNLVVEAAFKGMRPVVIALILAPTVALMQGINWWMAIVAVVAAVAIILLGVSPVWVLLVAIASGIVWGYIVKSSLK
ncbi:MAG: chromate transporter [Rikenellaceae bacterium]